MSKNLPVVRKNQSRSELDQLEFTKNLKGPRNSKFYELMSGDNFDEIVKTVAQNGENQPQNRKVVKKVKRGRFSSQRNSN